MGRHRNYAAGNPNSPIGPEEMLSRKISLSSAQLLNLFTNPVQLLPPPGPNLAYIALAMYITTRFGSVPYAGGGQMFAINGTAGTPYSDQGTLQFQLALSVDGSEGQFFISQTPPVPTPAQDTNQPMYLTNDTAAFNTGDGTAVITVFYVIASSQ